MNQHEYCDFVYYMLCSFGSGVRRHITGPDSRRDTATMWNLIIFTISRIWKEALSWDIWNFAQL